MKIKETDNVLAFCYSERTTLKQIKEIANREMEKLYNEANQLGLEEVSPMQFVYKGVDNNPDTEISLEICMIVKEQKGSSDHYYFRGLESFKCSYMMYKGDIDQISVNGYEKIIPETMKNGHQITKECREVYHDYIHPNHSENLTEIQIGID